MNHVAFSSLEAFAEELGFAARLVEIEHEGKVYQREPPTVRTEIERTNVNSGVTTVTLVSGFCDELERLYELRLECGEDWKGGEGEGSKMAETMLSQLKQLCEELHVPCRGGKWLRS